ncbi:MAG: flagellar hook-basal body protein [Opitutales bacterium]|nr:flagellar hook-basal body protein [Opitutales bacterium]
METGLYNAATSLASLQRWQEVTSQNIASSGVPGYKGQQMSFEAIHAGKMGIPTEKGSLSMPVTMAISTPSADFTGGMLKQTGSPTHMAIRGEGFFRIQGDGYEYISRDGEFHIDPDNQIVNKQGHPVLGETGPMRVQPNYGEITISRTGEITQGINKVGELDIVDYYEKESLIRVPGGFRVDPDNPLRRKEMIEPDILQGQLEDSNVTPMEQMVNLISVSRAFEVNQKVIQTLDEKMGKTIEVLGAT